MKMDQCSLHDITISHLTVTSQCFWARKSQTCNGLHK